MFGAVFIDFIQALIIFNGFFFSSRTTSKRFSTLPFRLIRLQRLALSFYLFASASAWPPTFPWPFRGISTSRHFFGNSRFTSDASRSPDLVAESLLPDA